MVSTSLQINRYFQGKELYPFIDLSMIKGNIFLYTVLDKEQTERDSLLKELNDVTNSKILEKLIQQAMYNSTSMKELESGLLKIRQKGNPIDKF